MHRIARNAESYASCGEVTVYHVVKSCCGHQVYPEAQESAELTFAAWKDVYAQM